MFEISVRARFSAAHHLAGYAGTCAVHHGHNWDVEVFIRGDDLNGIGMLVDFRDLKRHVREVLEQLDHKDLNLVEAFRSANPTSEHIARFLYLALAARLSSSRGAVHRVCVHETPETTATYWEE